MDLSIILWIGGTLFSLGIFAVKVGFGLGLGGMRRKEIFFTLSIYLVLFVFIAVLSGQLIRFLEPILRKGPYLHALMASGMIAWGIFLLKGRKEEQSKETKLKFRIRNSKNKNSELSTLNSLLLLIPCPVCLTAMTFSTWSALNVIKLPAALVGLGLGIVFILLSLGIFFSLKLITHKPSIITQKIGLGLSMIAIGFYFIASLYIPAKIEEAKAVYQSFTTEGGGTDLNQGIGVLALLFGAVAAGYFIRRIKT